MAAQRLDAVLGALADPASRRAVEVLGAGPKRAGELAHLLDLTAPAMSRKLKTLKQAGLVEEAHPEFDARVRIYALKAGAMDDLKTWLDRAERGWAEQLTALRDYLAKDA